MLTGKRHVSRKETHMLTEKRHVGRKTTCWQQRHRYVDRKETCWQERGVLFENIFEELKKLFKRFIHGLIEN